MIPQVDFEIVDSILRVLEGWELGDKGSYRKYWSYGKSEKNQNFTLVPGIQKINVYDFSGFFTKKNPETRESRVKRRFRESRVRRLFRCGYVLR